MIRNLLKMGHPLLRRRAREITPSDILAEPLQRLILDLIETMRANKGLGLAAPQVGEEVRICVAESQQNARYPEMTPLPLTVWINPVIEVLDSSCQIEMYEGCLSVPGLRGLVRRPAHIRVTSLNQTGETRIEEFEGLTAAIVQHECDHLDGRLFVDHASSESLSFQEEFEQFVPESRRAVVLRSE